MSGPSASLRVLFVAPAYWPAVAFGGPIWMARELTAGAARRGHEVHVVTSSLRAIGEPPASRLRSQVRELDGVTVHELATPLRYRWMGITPTLPLVLRSLPRPDVVHVFGYRDVVTTTTAAWCRLHGIPYVFEPLNMVKRQFRNVPLKRAFDRLIGARVVRGARLVVANSLHERDQLLEAGVGAERIVVRPNGFPPPHGERGDVLRKRLGLDPNAKLVLNVGRLSHKKGLDVLLDAVTEIPEVHVAIVGPDDGDGTSAELERRRLDPALAGRVHLVSPLGDHQPREVYGEADVFVLPSRDESFGMVAAEAAAAGVPVVVTDRCGVAETLGSRAALVVPLDAGAIREAVRRVLYEPDLAARLGAGGHEVAAETSWELVVALQEEIYRQALHE
jgi:glycosyltransferase involved in cell wall biosynthesis